MNIKLSSQQALGLAEEFANAIHGELITRHLIRSHGLCSCDDQFPAPARGNSNYREACAAIRSIEDKLDRINFVAMVRYYFNAKCQAHGTDRKWQDYVASVRAVQLKMKEAA